jgi:hypothetical protein
MDDPHDLSIVAYEKVTKERTLLSYLKYKSNIAGEEEKHYAPNNFPEIQIGKYVKPVVHKVVIKNSYNAEQELSLKMFNDEIGPRPGPMRYDEQDHADKTPFVKTTFDKALEKRRM